MLTIMNDTGGRKFKSCHNSLVLRPLLISLDEVNSIRQHSEFSFGSLEETIDLTHVMCFLYQFFNVCVFLTGPQS